MAHSDGSHRPRKTPLPKSRAGRALRIVGLLAALLVLINIAALMLLLVVSQLTGFDLEEHEDEMADHPQRIDNLDATIDVARDRTVTVTERLSYHHGPGSDGSAYRTIPARGEVAGYGMLDFGLRDVRVVDDGGAGPVSITGQSGEQRRITFGSGRLRGDHTITIRYRYDSVLVRGDHGPRLYYNVVGAGWEIPVAATRVTINAPAPPAVVDAYCGEPGSYTHCASTRTDGSQVTITAKARVPGRAVTVDLDLSGLDGDVGGLPGGSDQGHPSWWDRVNGGLGFFAAAAVIGGVGVARVIFALLRRPWPFSGGSGSGTGGGAGGGGGGGGAGGGAGGGGAG